MTSVWTVGHSTRGIEEFVGLLAPHGIQALADVRRFPSSSKYPHFDRDSLSGALAAAGIEYLALTELGGRRRALPGSRNTAWRNESFRGYADYMESAPFRLGVGRLLETARAKRTAMMCAEAVWWRCHRALISDHLKAAGLIVIHILGTGKSAVHPYSSAARIVDGRLTYAADDTSPLLQES